MKELAIYQAANAVTAAANAAACLVMVWAAWGRPRSSVVFQFGWLMAALFATGCWAYAKTAQDVVLVVDGAAEYVAIRAVVITLGLPVLTVVAWRMRRLPTKEEYYRAMAQAEAAARAAAEARELLERKNAEVQKLLGLIGRRAVAFESKYRDARRLVQDLVRQHENREELEGLLAKAFHDMRDQVI